MDLGLTDRVYVVTGGARGLGRATADVLVAEGARVVLSGRTEETLAAAARDLGEQAAYVVGDNAEPDLPARILACSMIHGGKAEFTQGADAVTITLDPNAMEAPSTIVVLDLDRSAEALAPIDETPINRGAKAKSSNADPSTDGLASNGDMRSAWKRIRSRDPWVSANRNRLYKPSPGNAG